MAERKSARLIELLTLLLTRRYGEAFLQSLPKVRRTEHLADVARFLDGSEC